MDVESLPQAMYIVFGLTYALHLNYPKYMKNTFDFFQQVLLNLGKTDLKPKLKRHSRISLQCKIQHLLFPSRQM